MFNQSYADSFFYFHINEFAPLEFRDFCVHTPPPHTYTKGYQGGEGVSNLEFIVHQKPLIQVKQGSLALHFFKEKFLSHSNVALNSYNPTENWSLLAISEKTLKNTWVSLRRPQIL